MFKSDAAKDDFFGEVGLTYDKLSNSFYIDKDIELDGVHTPVVLYIETNNKKASKRQFEVYKIIDSGFPQIKQVLVDFLSTSVAGLDKLNLEKNYRIESITIPVAVNADFKWEIDLINMEDGFSHILVEYHNLTPIHYSTHG